MAINNEVFTQIHPSLPQANQLAYINDNFRKLSDGFNPLIINNGEDNKILIGKKPDGSWGVYVAQDGYDVSVATPDQLIMSSDFNMYKIIANGTCTVTPRNADVTLTGNDIGYMFQVTLQTELDTTQLLSGDVRLKVVDSLKMDIATSGTLYNDGTNKAEYNIYYGVFDKELKVFFCVRLVAGTVVFNPYRFFNRVIYWDVCNQTNTTGGGSGAGGPGVGKYCFLDLRTYSSAGVAGTLTSSKAEFNNNLFYTGGPYQWYLFPYPPINQIAFGWFTS